LLNNKEANLNQLNNILLFLTSMWVKMYYFNTKRVIKKVITNQPIVMVKLLSFNVNKVH